MRLELHTGAPTAEVRQAVQGRLAGLHWEPAGDTLLFWPAPDRPTFLLWRHRGEVKPTPTGTRLILHSRPGHWQTAVAVLSMAMPGAALLLGCLQWGSSASLLAQALLPLALLLWVHTWVKGRSRLRRLHLELRLALPLAPSANPSTKATNHPA